MGAIYIVKCFKTNAAGGLTDQFLVKFEFINEEKKEGKHKDIDMNFKYLSS